MEIGDVVPDVKLRGDGAPCLQQPFEALVVLSVFNRLDGVEPRAEADDDVAARADFLRRLHRILVGERFDQKVRIFLFNRFGDFVDEMDQRAGLRAVFLHELRAGGALARLGLEGVVLRNGNHSGRGICLDLFQADSDEFLRHIFVGQAELEVQFAALPFAVDQREPIWMVFIVFFDGNELRERVAPADDGHMVAVRGRRDGEMAVVFQFGGKDISECIFVERFAADERRRIDDV